jgi:hypothetical protein
MTFFAGFPVERYKFGNEAYNTAFQNMSAYVEVIDRLKDDASFYTYYTILDGDRPDVLSQKFYGSVDFYWTFYFLNDELRKTGWPVSYNELVAFVQKKYPNTTIVTKDDMFNKFAVGEYLHGITSDTTAKIIDRNVDLGQIVVEGTKTFTDGETLEIVGSESTTLTLYSYSEQYNATRYYQNSNEEPVDISPFDIPGAEISIVTNLEYYNILNENNKQIKVLKRDVVNSVFSAFKRSLSEYVNV